MNLRIESEAVTFRVSCTLGADEAVFSASIELTIHDFDVRGSAGRPTITRVEDSPMECVRSQTIAMGPAVPSRGSSEPSRHLRDDLHEVAVRITKERVPVVVAAVMR